MEKLNCFYKNRITKPKFLYEIEEYQRIQKEIEKLKEDDLAEEIVIGMDNLNETYINNNQKVDVKQKLNKNAGIYNYIEKSEKLPDWLFQNNE